MSKEEWKKYNYEHFLSGYTDCFYQKKIIKDVYAEIVEYTIKDIKYWELNIKIPEKLSITGMTLNLRSFAFKELDFKKIEIIAKKIIKNLVK